MTAGFEDLATAFEDTVRRVADEPARLKQARADRVADHDRWRRLVDTGLLEVAVDEEDGGLALDDRGLAELFVAGGRALAPAAARDQAVVLMPALATSARAGSRWAAERLELARAGAVGGGGGTLRRGRARVEGEAVTIDGLMVWLGPRAELAGVVTPEAVVALDLSAPGVELKPVRSVDPGQGLHRLSARVRDGGGGALVPQAAAARIRRRWQLALAADAQGCAETVLDRSATYAAEREQFGRPIATFQAVAHTLADMHVGVTAGASALARLAALLVDGDPATDGLLAAVACWLPDRARRVCEQGIQVHGGNGFTWEYGLHLFYRRVLANQATLGGRRGATIRAGRILTTDRAAAEA